MMEVFLKRTIRLVAYCAVATVAASFGWFLIEEKTNNHQTPLPLLNEVHADAPAPPEPPPDSGGGGGDGGGGDDDDDDGYGL